MDWIPIGACDIQAYTENEKAALAILNDGKSYFHIAYKLHVSFERAREIVFDIRKKEGLIMGKLTDQQRAEIFNAWKYEEKTMSELAKEHGVSVPAISQLINKMNAQSCIDPAPAELEDVENGIPNTPLLPQKKRKAAQINPEFDAAVTEMIENADKNTAIAEKISENAEEWRLPIVVQDAVNRYIRDVSDEIEMRERRISDLNEELDTYRALYNELIAFRKAYREKVDLAEEKYEAD